MAKRGWYTYNKEKGPGFVFALRVAIKKNIDLIEVCDEKSLQMIPRVLQLKEEVVRLDRIREAMKSDKTGLLNLRVGDIVCLRKMKIDKYPELIPIKESLVLSNIKGQQRDVAADDEARRVSMGMSQLYDIPRIANAQEASSNRICEDPSDCNDTD